MSLIKVDKATFPAGTFSLYVKSAPHEREVEGKVVLHLSYPSFVKGVWIKLQGTASSFSPECGMVKVDLLGGEEEHHEDGMHQVEIMGCMGGMCEGCMGARSSCHVC
jgi:hypothetical protein